MNSRILLLALCCALTPSAWAGAGLTSAGVDSTPVNNNSQNEPTLAQVAPVANQGQPGTVSAGANAAAPNPVAAGAAGANGPIAANAAADGSKTPAATVAVAPTPPPPPPDPSTLPVSVIRPVNKSADNPAPQVDAEPVATVPTKQARHVGDDAPAQPMPGRRRRGRRRLRPRASRKLRRQRAPSLRARPPVPPPRRSRLRLRRPRTAARTASCSTPAWASPESSSRFHSWATCAQAATRAGRAPDQTRQRTRRACRTSA